MVKLLWESLPGLGISPGTFCWVSNFNPLFLRMFLTTLDFLKFEPFVMLFFMLHEGRNRPSSWQIQKIRTILKISFKRNFKTICNIHNWCSNGKCLELCNQDVSILTELSECTQSKSSCFAKTIISLNDKLQTPIIRNTCLICMH